MALTLEDLTDDERLEYWNRLEAYARQGRELDVYRTRTEAQLGESGVSVAAIDEVLTKETTRLETDQGALPDPDFIRELKTEDERG